MPTTAKNPGPKATAWDRVRSWMPNQTLANRDVHGTQQLDRSTIEKPYSTKPWAIGFSALGVLVTILSWIAISGIMAGYGQVHDQFAPPKTMVQQMPSYSTNDMNYLGQDCFKPTDAKGRAIGKTCYKSAKSVPQPQWHKDLLVKAKAYDAKHPIVKSDNSFGHHLMLFDFFKFIISIGLGAAVGVGLYEVAKKKIRAQNMDRDFSDINQHKGDQHVALPEEVIDRFPVAPDVGAHYTGSPSSMLGHIMLDPKGLKKVTVPVRAEEDILDSDGEIEYLKGEIIYDDNDEMKTKTVSIIDTELGERLFDTANLPKDKSIRRRFDATKIVYNPGGKNRDKPGKQKTLAEHINETWHIPDYETQRPAGAYIYDSAPVNTMVLAITRAGKGQTYIEPMIDLWSREDDPQNFLVNDPKGELLVKFYVRLTYRGFQVIQFNLINPSKTDIYNPLGLAAEAAREGDWVACAEYVTNIAEVFFPTDGGDDPMWANAANNAFKRAAYGLIDYYLEEERQLRARAARDKMSPVILENELDEMWGKVTLYNCYQFFVQLTSKKKKRPDKELIDRVDAGEFKEDDPEDEARFEAEQIKAEAAKFLWNGNDEVDFFSLFFNATEHLPMNGMREMVNNANNALKSMATAEKMLASVYGIAVTAMSFFSNPTISAMTSGRPSQNVDLGGLSFPRRFGVRFANRYLKKTNIIGMQARWSAYGDAMFTQNLGKDFYHEELVGREGWARYYFMGKFKERDAYLKLEIVDPRNSQLINTFYFQFRKSWLTSLDGRRLTSDPITGEHIVRNGILMELQPVTDALGAVTSYKPAPSTYPRERLTNISSGEPEKVMGNAPVFISTSVRYSEQVKAIFMVTPPHLQNYAKLLLILIKQLVDLNFAKSYATKPNQKPLYKTRYMLDELGNLQSEGHGISGFATMLSIGLGQEQQFTLILQTLQQLKDVYGDSVDKIVQGNTNNIVFLKSTDDTMIETLSKISGTKHESYIDGKSITRSVDSMIKLNANDGKITYNASTSKVPVLDYNDFAFLAPCQSIVMRAGDPPIWNRNETSLPMSYELHKREPIHPGHEYAFQTVPSMSTAMEFDVRMNQPDFEKIMLKRVGQAIRAEDARNIFMDAYGYKDVDMHRLDPDEVSNDIMELVDDVMWDDLGRDPDAEGEVLDIDFYDNPYMSNEYEDNTAVKDAAAKNQVEADRRSQKRFANHMIAIEDLQRIEGEDGAGGAANRSLEGAILEAFKACRGRMFADSAHFQAIGDDLYSHDGQTAYIVSKNMSAELAALRQASEDSHSRIFDTDGTEMSAEDLLGYEVRDEFFLYLASLPSWKNVAQGEFEREMTRQMTMDDNLVGAV